MDKCGFMSEIYFKTLSKDISLLIKKQKLNEALELIEEILNDPNLGFKTRIIFQNQKTTVLVKLGRNKEALELIEEILENPNLDFKNYLIAKNNKTITLMNLGRNEEALRLTEEILNDPNLDFKSHIIFQNQKTTVLINLGRNKEALELIEEILENPNLDFKNYMIAKNNKTKVLINLGRNEEALKLIEETLNDPNLDFKNYMIVKNNKTTVLINLGRNEEALKLIEETLNDPNLDFKNYIIFQSQKTTAMINLERNEEALKLIEEILENPNLDLKSCMITKNNKITVLINLGRNEEALRLTEEILNDPNLDFKTCIIFLNQKTTAMINLERNEEALNLIEETLNDPKLDPITRKIFQTQKKKILSIVELEKDIPQEIQAHIKELFKNNISTKSYTSELFTRIYCDDINITELEQANIDTFEKVVLQIAYYEKNNKKKGIQFINHKKQELDEKKQTKILNRLKEKLVSKREVFDCGLYASILNTTIDFALASQIDRKKQTPVNPKPESREVSIPKKEPTIKKEVSSQTSSKVVVSPMQVIPHKKRQVVKSLETNHQKKKEICIKDLFADELHELGKYLYCQMASDIHRKSAIQAWDNLEILSQKSIHDKSALEKMLVLLNCLENQKNQTEIQMQDVFSTEFAQIESCPIAPVSAYFYPNLQMLKEANINNVEAFKQVINLSCKFNNTPEETEKIARLIKKYYE